MLSDHCRRLPLGLLALGLLAACETRRPAAEQAATAPATADSTAAVAVSPAVAAPDPAAAPATAAAFAGYHRYVGTVGQAPVVLELTISPPTGDEKKWYLYGTYYYERRGQQLELSAAGPYQPGQPLELQERAPKPGEPAETLPSGRWRATQAAGPVLSGTWESPDGRRRLPFALREDYRGAVPYELLTEKATGQPCPPTEDGSSPHQPEATREFLHLLGPDTLQPALRALQAPLPEQRRNQLAVELDEADCDDTFGYYGGVEVVLNGYGLLTLVRSEGEYSGGAYPNSVEELTTYDLRTGRALKLADWLQPGQEPALRRLLQQRLRTHPYASSLNLQDTDLSKADLSGLGFDSEGVFCLLGDFGAPHVVQRVPVVVPYRELRPLLRPGSAVARMLQRRGLW